MSQFPPPPPSSSNSTTSTSNMTSTSSTSSSNSQRPPFSTPLNFDFLQMATPIGGTPLHPNPTPIPPMFPTTLPLPTTTTTTTTTTTSSSSPLTSKATASSTSTAPPFSIPIPSSSSPSSSSSKASSIPLPSSLPSSSSSSSNVNPASFLFGKSNPLAALGLDPLSNLIMQSSSSSSSSSSFSSSSSSSFNFNQERSLDAVMEDEFHQEPSSSSTNLASQPQQPKIDLSLHPSGILPILQNIVATVNLGCKLDLKNIALHARNAEYNPKRFAAVIMRIREPKTTALIFASGKMVVTGAKSEDLSRLAARKYARIIQKLGFKAKFTDFKIQNIVGSCDVKFPIRLEGLAYSHGQFSSYEPELFPGLIYRMIKPKIVLLIFVSGKIVLTGAKVREEIYEAFEKIYPVLSDFKKIS